MNDECIAKCTKCDMVEGVIGNDAVVEGVIRRQLARCSDAVCVPLVVPIQTATLMAMAMA